MAPDICLLYRQKALLWLTPTFAFSSPVRPFEPYYRDRGRQVNRGATAVSSLPTLGRGTHDFRASKRGADLAGRTGTVDLPLP